MSSRLSNKNVKGRSIKMNKLSSEGKETRGTLPMRSPGKRDWCLSRKDDEIRPTEETYYLPPLTFNMVKPLVPTISPRHPLNRTAFDKAAESSKKSLNKTKVVPAPEPDPAPTHLSASRRRRRHSAGPLSPSSRLARDLSIKEQRADDLALQVLKSRRRSRKGGGKSRKTKKLKKYKKTRRNKSKNIKYT